MCVSLCQSRSGNAALIESFENTLDGWQVPVTSNSQAFVPSFSSTTGVTDGNYSLSITGTGTSGPNYGQMLLSPTTLQLTSVLADAASVSLDVYTPPASFGYFLQFDVDIYNNDTGYVSLDNYSYPGVTIGAESTITVPVSSSLQAELAASSNPTYMAIQVGGGYTAGNETFYLDNIRTTAVPEPSTLALLGVCAFALLGFGLRKRKQAA
jgi:hypothetical protein